MTTTTLMSTNLFSIHLLVKVLGLTLAIILLLTGIVYVANLVVADDSAQAMVQQFGYLGVLVAAFIAGLNAIVPVPAWTLVPIFVAAGLWMPLIIVFLVIGTTLADLLAFYLGMKGRELAAAKYKKMRELTAWFEDGRMQYVIPVVFLYASFSPFPNEVLLVPLALMGVHLRTVIFPLLLGTVIYQTAFALGVQSIFTTFLIW